VVRDDDAENQARATAERLGLALAVVRAGVFEVDHRTRRWWFSPEFISMLGRELTEEEVFAEVWPIYPAEDTERVLQTIKDSYANDADEAVFEARIVKPSGEMVWTEFRMTARRDEEGHFCGVVGLVLNIEERKRQEAQFSRLRLEAEAMAERLHLATTSAKAGAFEIDFKTRSLWCSPEFDQIVQTPVTFDDVCRPVWSVCHPDDAEAIEQAIHDTRDGAGRMEWRLIRPDGEIRWVETNAKAHFDESGAISRVVGLIADADDRKRQELALIEAERNALAAGEAKAQFLANMSHEIRTPMNGVLGILRLLHAEPLTEEGRSMVAQAEACGQMLAQILDDVIDLSKIDAGRLELAPEPVDAAQVLMSVADLLRAQAEAKGITFNVRVGGADGWAMIDPIRLRQALFNLIGNAIKFTAKGQVEARLFVSDAPEGKRLRFEVEDSGIGIPAAAQGALFQRFQQADGSTARQFGGSGLGLVITRSLAEMMGGEVGFESVEGHGSTFWLDVLAATADPAEAAAVEQLPSLAGVDILLVEDNPTNRLVATKILEGLGASVTTAEDGVEAVDAVMGRTFDLVLMDVQMPRMDGVQATRRIRAMPQGQGLPIVGLTANVMLHQWKAYREAGMDGVASKPISPRALLTEIGRVLQQAEASRAA
jgi:PAS domain S-box-containing protein